MSAFSASQVVWLSPAIRTANTTRRAPVKPCVTIDESSRRRGRGDQFVSGTTAIVR